MLRCATLVVAALACAAPAGAQSSRPFPATALRGTIVLTQPPDITLNGDAARLAPGARIRGVDNLQQLSGSLQGQRLTVNYTTDLMGQLLEVWILSAEERARQPWPTSREQAAAWTFDPAAQTWSKP